MSELVENDDASNSLNEQELDPPSSNSNNSNDLEENLSGDQINEGPKEEDAEEVDNSYYNDNSGDSNAENEKSEYGGEGNDELNSESYENPPENINENSVEELVEIVQRAPEFVPLELVGDDNNNDQPDDVNNNTTDPQMQQIQQEQIRLHQEQNQPPAAQEPIQNQAKNKRRKKKKRKNFPLEIKLEPGTKEGNEENQIDVEIEYIAEKLELSVFDPMYKAFANVFETFRLADTSYKSKNSNEDVKPKVDELNKLSKVPKPELEDDLLEDIKKEDEKPKLSKRKLKKLTRLSVAELKQIVPRPDVVEMHDVTARDPKLLVHLKSYRNTVPVPRHWCFKRKYLQGKRGIEKAPFDLPGFIKKTGIMEMRAALAEKEDSKTLKAKMRERVRPKMGKIDVDYQKLHDAFFKWQSKPKMTIHGDLYYEGKEFETRMKDKKPGDLSDDLRTALGMPIGPNSNRIPPPWLIAMQRYGPPPSYPHQKIPGLNAPIPEGCSFGYHAGGWGKPPVDEFGRPLYGDVFGLTNPDGTDGGDDEVVDKGLWGELESEEEGESEEEDEEEEEETNGTAEPPSDDPSGLTTPAEGLATPSGFSSIPPGLETPQLIELRKRRIEQDMEGGDTPSLYTVLPEKRVDRISGSMMASTHVYDLSAAPPGVRAKADSQGRVELALDPSELDLDSEAMAARYEQKLKEEQSHLQKEDLSDMVAEHAAKQKNKRKRQMQQPDANKQAKKYKEFKF